MRLKFYADLHIPKQVPLQLRAKGIVIVRCGDVDMEEAEDEEQLHYAAENDLVLLTRDEKFRARHFYWLAESKQHCGIFFYGDWQGDAITALIDTCLRFHEWVASGKLKTEDLHNQFVYIR